MDKARILTVDDTPSNLEVLASLLIPKYKVIAATNGKDALRITMSSSPPDLILLDIMMPDMDGYEVCSFLKAHEETKNIPVIFLTAMTAEDEEERGFRLGAVDYITKPFVPSILEARIKTHLHLHNNRLLLEEEVKERTQKLEKARLEAEQANMAKSLFLTNMNHELRTPLNGIMGITRLLMDTHMSDEQKEYLNHTLESSTRLLNIINDVMELASFDAGKMSFSPVCFRVEDIFEDMSHLYGNKALQQGIEFYSVEHGNAGLMYMGDVKKIRQILIYVLNNALRYTKAGKICLACDVIPFSGSVSERWESLQKQAVWPENVEKSENRQLKFSISDTGVGIAEDKLSTLFDAFNIGENTLTKAHSGAGLGLTISKCLVEQMGGSIWLDSKEGVGTTVYFTIPCCKEKPTEGCGC